MMRSLIALAVVFTLAFPAASFGVEPTEAALEKVDAEVSKKFPGLKPCLCWERESTGLRRVYSDRPMYLFKNVRVVVVTISENGIVRAQDGDKTHTLDIPL